MSPNRIAIFLKKEETNFRFGGDSYEQLQDNIFITVDPFPNEALTPTMKVKPDSRFSHSFDRGK